MHETDYRRARRQSSDVKKHGITGATPKEAGKNIKKHEMAKKMGYKQPKGTKHMKVHPIHYGEKKEE